MYQFVNKSKEEIIANMSQIETIYKSVKMLYSPDFMHLYGLLNIKAGKIEKAEEVLSDAIDKMKSANGVLNSRSDLVNNLIEIYQNMQNDLPDIFKRPSRYSAETVLEC